jgi:lipopolysaccharide biosynthesis glycosyltransferase
MVQDIDIPKERISVSFSASDNFSQHLAVLIVSILVNNPESFFIFHILHKSISKENQKKIIEITRKYNNCEIIFHSISKLIFSEAKLPSFHITEECYYRLLLPKILYKEKRTLYLDIDILVFRRLSDLWNINLDGYACAAVCEGQYPRNSLLCYAKPIALENQRYFNSGVILFNLEYIRNENLSLLPFDILKEWGDKVGYADQDVLNLAYYGKVKFISQSYNFMGKWLLSEKPSKVVIRHYTSFSQKPWNCKLKRFTWIKYAWYLAKSPYRDSFILFVLMHLRSFLYWRYVRNGYPSLDICGVRIWKGGRLSD